MIHSKNQKRKSVINCLAKHGMSVSYNTVRNVQLSVTKTAMQEIPRKTIWYVHRVLKRGTVYQLSNRQYRPQSVISGPRKIHSMVQAYHFFQHPDVEVETVFPDFKNKY